MLDRLFGGDSFLAATRGLDASALRHQTISNNLANVNTPGYKRQEVQFESQLSQALQSSKNPCSLGSSVANVRPCVATINTTSERQDGNNVDMEKEMTDLAVNTMNFDVLSQSVAGYFSALKNVINGR